MINLFNKVASVFRAVRSRSNGRRIVDECRYLTSTTSPDKILKLIRRGASLDEVNSLGWPLLMIAIVNDNTDVACALIGYGARLDRFKSGGDTTVLMKAAQHGLPLVVQAMVQKGASLNDQDSSGWTALMWAAIGSNADTVKVLLDAGADMSLKSDLGNTAKDMACGDLKQLFLAAEEKLRVKTEAERQRQAIEAERIKLEHAQWVKDCCPAKEPISMKTIRPVKRQALKS